mgnify:FL=1
MFCLVTIGFHAPSANHEVYENEISYHFKILICLFISLFINIFQDMKQPGIL